MITVPNLRERISMNQVFETFVRFRELLIQLFNLKSRRPYSEIFRERFGGLNLN